MGRRGHVSIRPDPWATLIVASLSAETSTSQDVGRSAPLNRGVNLIEVGSPHVPEIWLSG